MMKKSISGRLTDGLRSMMTSLGERVAAITYANDKPEVSDGELLAMYKKSWIVKKYIDKTADDMLKRPREFSGDIDDALLTRIADCEQTLSVSTIFRDALTWASLLGDVLVVAVTDCDKERLPEPLRLQDEKIIKFLVLRKDEYKPGARVISAIESPHFGRPQTYQVDIGGGQIRFHHSRCHRIRLGKHSLKNMAKFGTSDLQAPYSAIKIFDTAIVSTGDTIQEANVDVIFLSGMNDQISAGQEEQVAEYARVMKATKSSTGLMLIDAGNEIQANRYEQKNAQFAGLSDVITRMANVLSGALDRPVTVLFGQSASGFSSGEEDNKAYYETITGLQESRLRPMQDFVDQFILDKLSEDSGGISYSYPTIDSINETDEANRFTQYANGFTAMVTASLITEDIALREMVARRVLTTVTGDDIALTKGASREQWSHGSETDAGVQTGFDKVAFPASSPPRSGQAGRGLVQGQADCLYPDDDECCYRKPAKPCTE